MKHIHSYKIFESQEEYKHPGFPKTEEEIHRLCELYDIHNYSINDDLSIDVQGNVHLYNEGLSYIPMKFNYINGNFRCYYNHLITLRGSPKIVNGYFNCGGNDLKYLEYAPNEVNGDINCRSNNIKTLEYLPKGIDYTHEYTKFDNNPIYSLVNTFIKNKKAEELIQEFNDYSIVREDKVLLNRLKAFINDFDLEMPNIDEVKKYYKIV